MKHFNTKDLMRFATEFLKFKRVDTITYLTAGEVLFSGVLEDGWHWEDRYSHNGIYNWLIKQEWRENK